jgi:hypothetical protein
MIIYIDPKEITVGDYVRARIPVKKSIIAFQFNDHNGQVKSRAGDFITVKTRTYKLPQAIKLSAVLKAWRFTESPKEPLARPQTRATE